MCFKQQRDQLENNMTLYVKTSRDRFELPLAVADTKAELARMLGMDRSRVSHYFNDQRRNDFIAVEVEEADPGEQDPVATKRRP